MDKMERFQKPSCQANIASNRSSVRGSAKQARETIQLNNTAENDNQAKSTAREKYTQKNVFFSISTKYKIKLNWNIIISLPLAIVCMLLYVLSCVRVCVREWVVFERIWRHRVSHETKDARNTELTATTIIIIKQLQYAMKAIYSRLEHNQQQQQQQHWHAVYVVCYCCCVCSLDVFTVAFRCVSLTVICV